MFITQIDKFNAFIPVYFYRVMPMNVIYVDVLFCVNFIVNYILLLSTSSLMRIQSSGLRMCLGAVVGALCSFVILLPPMGLFLNFLLRAVISIVTVLPVFKFKSLQSFLKVTVSFLMMGFLFAGMMFAIMQLLSPSGLVVNNTSVYINISPSFIIIMTLICYSALSIFERFVSHRLPKETECTVKISMNKKNVICKGITDTGNSLRETFSDYPVIIVEAKSLEPLIPLSVSESYLKTGNSDDSFWSKRIRLIPYNTVSGEGVLTAFRPDEVTVCFESKEIKTKRVYIAISNRKISNDFEAILNSEIIKSI